MKKKLNSLVKKYGELIRYIFVGGMTTLVNFAVYFSCISFGVGWFFANSLSWVFAVVFAFYANKRHVFKSKLNTTETGKEFLQFTALRLVTLAVETGILYVAIQLLSMDENISKIIVSFVTIISNYVFCKFMIFKPQEGGL